ncbi:hypothetical protein Tco_0078540 [Tanacetum coccineum]
MGCDDYSKKSVDRKTRSDCHQRRVYKDDVAKIFLGSVMDTLKFTAMPFGLTNAPVVFMELMSRFQQRWNSGAKRKLYRCGRIQMGNEDLGIADGSRWFRIIMTREEQGFGSMLEREKVIACTSRNEGSYERIAWLTWIEHEAKITMDVIAKLPSLSSGYDAIGCSQWTD